MKDGSNQEPKYKMTANRNQDERWQPPGTKIKYGGYQKPKRKMAATAETQKDGSLKKSKDDSHKKDDRHQRQKMAAIRSKTERW